MALCEAHTVEALTLRAHVVVIRLAEVCVDHTCGSRRERHQPTAIRASASVENFATGVLTQPTPRRTYHQPDGCRAMMSFGGVTVRVLVSRVSDPPPRPLGRGRDLSVLIVSGCSRSLSRPHGLPLV